MPRESAADRADLAGAAGISMRAAEAAELEAEADELEADEAEADPAAEAPRRGYTPLRQYIGADPDPGPDTVDNEPWDIPAAVRPYLKPDELRVIALRRHIIRLGWPAAAFLGGLAAAAALNGWAYSAHHARPTMVHVIWWAWLIGAGWAVIRYAEWRQTWFVVTGHRVMLIEATRVLGRKIHQLPADKLRDLTFNQSPLGRALGYASFSFASIGTDKALGNALDTVAWLPWPEWLYGQINDLMMPEPTRKTMKRGRKQ